jgi:predicted ester cyclase
MRQQTRLVTNTTSTPMSYSDLRSFYTRYVEALNARDFHRLDEFLNDEIHYYDGTFTRDQVAGALAAEVDAVPDLSWELEDFRIDGDTIAARLTNRGTPAKEWLGVAPTGTAFEITEYALYKLRDGRFVTMANLHDSETLRRQLHG